MQSARDHPEVISVYLADECEKGRVLGPFRPGEVSGVQTSRFGVILKKGHDKWCLILDLSSPKGRSVNDGIWADLCSLFFVSVDDAARAGAVGVAIPDSSAVCPAGPARYTL